MRYIKLMINSQEVKIKVQNIFEKKFKKKINEFEKLEFNKTKYWDSLKHIQLIVSLEKEFNIKITTSDVEKLTSYKKIIKHFN